MPDCNTGDPSLIAVHQAAGVLRELLGLSIENALRLLQVAADVLGYDVGDLARIIVVGASRGALHRHA
jgi:hypothetical protein